MEDGANSRNLVIKVKYGDSLKRFSACVNGNSIDHDMRILRSKIISLFKFSPDADLVLQYTDVEGDLITLETDEELYDAIINQSLNPLRITVQLNTETRSESSNTNRLSRAPAELSFLQNQTNTELSALQDRINISVKKALKTVPEPVQVALANLSEDFLSKAAASVPMFTDIVGSLSKLGLSNHFPSQVFSNRASGSLGDVSSNQSDLNMGTTSNSLVTPDGLLLDAVFVQKGNSDDKSTMIPSHSISTSPSTDDGRLETHKEDVNRSNSCTESIPVTEVGQGISFQGNELPVSDLRSPASDTAMEKSYSEHSASVLNMGSGKNGQVNTLAIGSPLHTVTSHGSAGPFMLHGRSHFMHHTNFPPAVHPSIICGGCGMRPIVGPRYKSNVKHDHDLCGFCFSKMGSDKDYVCIDQPTFPYQPPRPNPHTFRGPRMRSRKAKLESRFVQDVTIRDGTLVVPSTPFMKIWRMHNNGAMPWPRGTQLLWIGGDQISHRNFVELEAPENGFPVNTEVDIAVDCVAPSVPGRYISYWRLATLSGQKFGQHVWVKIQVDNCHGHVASAYGYQSEIDLYPRNDQQLPWIVGAPFEPNGNNSNKFPDFVDRDRTQDDRSSNVVVPVLTGGVRTSVYSNDATESSQFTPETTSLNGSYPVVDPSVVSLAPPHTVTVPPTTSGTVLLPPLSVPKSTPLPPFSTPGSVPLLPVPIPAPMPPLAVSVPAPPAPQSVSVHPSSTHRTAPLSSYPAISPALTDPQSSTLAPSGLAPDNDLELVLLKELEGMGFKEVEVNKDMLRKNEYDLPKTIDDLCGVAEWDPLLNELRVMGFLDEELNKKLLIKNDGSIKRVVLDLISGKD